MEQKSIDLITFLLVLVIPKGFLMRKSMITLMMAVVVIIFAAVVISMVMTGVIYAQDIGTTQAACYSNSTIVKRLNSIIIDAINARIRSVYGEDG